MHECIAFLTPKTHKLCMHLKIFEKQARRWAGCAKCGVSTASVLQGSVHGNHMIFAWDGHMLHASLIIQPAAQGHSGRPSSSLVSVALSLAGVSLKTDNSRVYLGEHKRSAQQQPVTSACVPAHPSVCLCLRVCLDSKVSPLPSFIIHKAASTCLFQVFLAETPQLVIPCQL